MNREIFKNVVREAARQNPGQPPDVIAEAAAEIMDQFARIMGGASPLPAAAPEVIPAPPPATPFPSVNPAAVGPIPPIDVLSPTIAEPQLKQPATPLVTLETRIPSAEEIAMKRARAPEPLRSIRPGAVRMKVEELNLLIQERTPVNLILDVPQENGGIARTVFQRNVISMHAHDSVQLVYYPPNATQSVREAAEVQTSIHLDDLPVDLGAIVEGLRKQAIDSVRPRRPIVSVTPPTTAGAVRHSGDTYQDPTLQQVQQIFNSMG